MFFTVAKANGKVAAEFHRLTDSPDGAKRYYVAIDSGDVSVHLSNLTREDMADIIDRLETSFKALTDETQPTVEPTASVSPEPTGSDDDDYRPFTGDLHQEQERPSPEFPHGKTDRGCQHVLPGEPACGVCWSRNLVNDLATRRAKYDASVAKDEGR